MDKQLQTYNLPKLNQRKSENLNSLITTNEIETVIKKLLINKSPEPDGFTGEFYHISRKELTHILLKLFQKFQEERILPSSFNEVSIILILKPDALQRKKIIGQHSQ